QPAMWVTATNLPTAASHPFYRRLNQLLREHSFDAFVEAQCAGFYAATMGRPSLPPGIYFRLLLIGYFEGIDSERGIAWRAADSFALRDFLGLVLPEAPPDHSYGLSYASPDPESLQAFAKEARRGGGARAAVHQDVEHAAGIIDGPPQRGGLPVDHQTQFIKVPDVGAGAPRPSVVGRTSCRTAAPTGGSF